VACSPQTWLETVTVTPTIPDDLAWVASAAASGSHVVASVAGLFPNSGVEAPQGPDSGRPAASSSLSAGRVTLRATR
jgi:hypothetical protein